MERRAKKTPFKKSEGRGRGRDRDKDLFSREMRKKVCRFCADKLSARDIDYKDLNRIARFVTDRGKILSRRISGTCARHQRRVCLAIKRARFLGLLR